MILKAININPKIKLKSLSSIFPYERVYTSNYEVIFKTSENSYIVLYSFGVYVLVNTSDEIAHSFMVQIKEQLKDYEIGNYDDTYNIEIDTDSVPKIGFNKATLPSFSLEHIRIISLILAESVALDAFEEKTENILDKCISYSRVLQKNGKYPKINSELLKFVGFAMATRQEILNNLHVTDAPDETWNNIELERIFLKMKEMFDIESRFMSLDLSLNAIQDSLELIANFMQARKSHNVEWMIVILILIEILMTIYDKIF
jgi:uncharacterized Rmd1/YagE family protein